MVACGNDGDGGVVDENREEIKMVVLMVKMVGKMAILVKTMVVMKVMEEWWMEIEKMEMMF